MIERERQGSPLAYKVHVGSVVPRLQPGKIRLAQKCNRHRMSSGIARWIGVHANKSQVAHDKAGLFEGLAATSFFHSFIHIDEAPGKRVVILERFMTTPDEDNALAMKDHAIHSDRSCWKGQQHTSCVEKFSKP